MSDEQSSEAGSDAPDYGSSPVEEETSDQTEVESSEETVAETESNDENVVKESFEETRAAALDAIAREVLNGHWGNGQDRRLRLSQAGFDHREVQARVNQILAERR